MCGQEVLSSFFVYLFVALLGLHCCAQAFSGCGEGGYSLVAVQRLPIVVACSVVAPRLWVLGSAVVVRGLSCCVAFGIFPGQGLNLCGLLWQTGSYLLCHQGSPKELFWWSTMSEEGQLLLKSLTYVLILSNFFSSTEYKVETFL